MVCKECGHRKDEHHYSEIQGHSCNGFYEYEDGCHTHQDDCPCKKYEKDLEEI